MEDSYPREIYETKIKNLNLKIIGVDHRMSVLKKYEDFFREEINSPDYIFFEMGLEGSNFYKRLAKLLDNQEKSIYVPDSLYKGFGANDIILGGIGADLFVTNATSLRKSLSRRDFFKKSCMGLAGLYLATTIRGVRENILQNILGKDATLDNKIAYDALQDFRNIICSDNFIRAGNELGFEGNGTFFIGYSHLNGLRAYINNPNMRKKRRLYPHLECHWTYEIKEYKNKFGEWKLARFL